MMDIYRLPALRDNYIFLRHDPEQQLAIASDPGEAAPVLQQVRAVGTELPTVQFFCLPANAQTTCQTGAEG